jgi:large subunit ribosomal protein L15
MKQNTLKSTAGSKKTRKRVGRGGPRRLYAGRGMNGQNSRSGGGVRPGFEGGQTTLLNRMPKVKGFRNPCKVEYFALNLSRLEQAFNDGDTVNVKTLVEKGVFKKEQAIKLLGQGELTKKLNITVEKASQTAIDKVEKAGGKLTLLKAKTETTTETSEA